MRTIVTLFILLCLASFAAAEPQAASAPTDSLTAKLRPTLSDQWFGADKAHHFMVSACLTGFTYYAARQELNQSHQAAFNGAVGITFTVGIGKELWDGLSGRGHPSFKDVVANVAGIAVGMLVINSAVE